MSLVLDFDEPLTADEAEQVRTFAAFLVTRRQKPSAPAPQCIDVDAVAGMCAGMGGDKSSVELVHEAMDAMAAKYMREE